MNRTADMSKISLESSGAGWIRCKARLERDLTCLVELAEETDRPVVAREHLERRQPGRHGRMHARELRHRIAEFAAVLAHRRQRMP